MAEQLARIYGTEQDKVNCPFYFKIGACRHGDRCSRKHNKPLFSQTLVLANMFQTRQQLAQLNGHNIPAEDFKADQQHLEDYVEDLFEELAKYGTVEEMHLCANVADHLCGNVYIKYSHEDEAEKCLKGVMGRFYEGRPVVGELSPVTDFREARCRQFEMGECARARSEDVV
eukprot:TRINITY_DN1650_c0_g1_i1.p1 TRINITY_DN1650_c0_g1~~TRINITY_DN1650_c0_g1_i1.p1  ORF type:complete len:193 (+),score=42.27 TRINITY_DN1650_c0_g1_i1:64-579(+)